MANQRIGLLKRCFERRSEQFIKTIYDFIIRPVLEYASPAWNPYYQNNISMNLKKLKRER